MKSIKTSSGTRITPACAGKRALRIFAAASMRDHPRVCGEKSPHIGGSRFKPGSPPPVRGKDTGFPPGALCHGITPAYAGKSLRRCNCTHPAGDHPRVCGEKRKYHCRYARRLGSPPRMRGKGTVGALPTVTSGITPAYAGKRVLQPDRSIPRQDHPRVCGEKSCVK